MPIYLILFAGGVISASFLPQLPSLAWGGLFIPLMIFAYWARGASTYALRLCAPALVQVSAFLVGCGWGVYCGQGLLGLQLPQHQANHEFLVTGFVDGLPQADQLRTRFVLKVDQVTNLSGTVDTSWVPDNAPLKLQLGWYFAARHSMPSTIKTGDYWQLRVRLKAPRGFVNPAGFDYQAWLLRRHIGATGYVVDDRRNQLLPVPSKALSFTRWIDVQRYQLQQWLLAHSDSSERGILVALLIGDGALVDKTQWQRMQQTGTNHLIAISGLHVGFLAIFGFYIGLWLGKAIQLCGVYRCPALILAYASAIGCALFYSALAGFNIPTLRTAIMLTLFYWLAIHRRSVRGVDIYCVALALVVILDPLAAFDMGFWLSFGAVGLLLFYFSGRYLFKRHLPKRYISRRYPQPWQGFAPAQLLMGFIRSQWVMFIGLLVPLSLLIHSVSLLAPLANFIAIPLITFFVVPCLLLAAALQGLVPGISQVLLHCAETAMEYLAIWLDVLLEASQGKLNPIVAFTPGVVALLLVSCVIVLLPKGLITRSLGYVGILLSLLLAFVLPPPAQSGLRVTVLDVGQGTAVVVEVFAQSQRHTLVYDTGPAYSDDFDAGSAIIAPYLRSRGITRINTLVVSHLDKDHAGGLDGLLGHLAVDELLLGELPRQYQSGPAGNAVGQLIDNQAGTRCHQASPWRWGDVDFRFITWTVATRASSNNHSCVLLIHYAGQYILLPGDIERDVEQQLVRSRQLPQTIDLLLAAHHGSQTSSTAGFINYTNPRAVVYSAGYGNRYGHPHPKVRARYQAMGSQEWNTATEGALVFEWHDQHRQPEVAYRRQYRRYWFAND